MSYKSTILIVDDEPIGRQLIDAILYKEGYNLEFAENGREAFEKAKSVNPDLILMDVMMPEIDGFEVCQMLRADEQMNNVPIILVTALDDIDSRIRGLEAGADDYISKPFDRLELLARIKIITRLNRYRRGDGTPIKENQKQAPADVGITTQLEHLIAGSMSVSNDELKECFNNVVLCSIFEEKKNNNIVYSYKNDDVSGLLLAGSCVKNEGPALNILNYVLANKKIKSAPECGPDLILQEVLNNLNSKLAGIKIPQNLKPSLSLILYNKKNNETLCAAINTSSLFLKNGEVIELTGDTVDFSNIAGNKITLHSLKSDPGNMLFLYPGTIGNYSKDNHRYIEILKNTLFENKNENLDGIKEKICNLVKENKDIENNCGNVKIIGMSFN